MNLTANHRGFSLLEVLIALLVFSLGMLGLAALQSYSIKANQSAHFRSQATALANTILDNIRANRTSLADYYDNTYAAVDCATPPAGSGAALDLALWQQQIACQLPDGRGTVAPIAGTNEVAVCIRWNDARDETGGSADGSCTADAATYAAGTAGGGSGAGTDGAYTVFVVAARM
ncbi:MAG TPA: type IV pilus modification protein PilV [Rhodanobacteraceae bacterium]|nr:type IV pilus modification protein PilV [Rhodanobacteraceae bacterium]